MPTSLIDVLRARLGSPTATELSDTILERDCLAKALELYSKYRPSLVFSKGFDVAEADVFEYALPAGCRRVLSCFICNNDDYSTTEIREELRQRNGYDDTGYDNSNNDHVFWSQVDNVLVLSAPADAGADINIYYEGAHVLDNNKECLTLQYSDQQKILEGAEGYARLIHAGYGGRLVEGASSEDRDPVRKQGQEQVKAFEKWAKSGYVP